MIFYILFQNEPICNILDFQNVLHLRSKRYLKMDTVPETKSNI